MNTSNNLENDVWSWETDSDTTFIRAYVLLFNNYALAANLIILLVIPRIPEHSMQDSTKVFYMGLAITDMLAASLVIVGIIFDLIVDSMGWTTAGRVTFCRTLGLLLSVTPGISIQHILLLNTDRHLLIAKPLLHRRISTRRRSVAVCAALATVNTLGVLLWVRFNKISWGIVRFHPKPGTCMIDFSEPTFLPCTLSLFAVAWLTMVLIVIQYCHIIMIARKHQRKIGDASHNAPRYGGQNRLQSAQLQNRPGSKVTDVACSSDIGSSFPTPAHAGSCSDPNPGCASSELQGKRNPNELPALLHSIQIPQLVIASPVSSVVYTPEQEAMDHACTSTETGAVDAHQESPAVHYSARTTSPSIIHGWMTSRNSTTVPVNIDGYDEMNPHPEVAPGAPGGPSKNLRRDLKAYWTPLIITVAFFVTFLPGTFLNTYLAVNARDGMSMYPERVDNLSHILLTMLVNTHGGITIWIYILTVKPFREALHVLLKEWRRCCIVERS